MTLISAGFFLFCFFKKRTFLGLLMTTHLGKEDQLLVAKTLAPPSPRDIALSLVITVDR